MSKKENKEEIDVEKLNKVLKDKNDKNNIEAFVGLCLIIVIIYFAIQYYF